MPFFRLFFGFLLIFLAQVCYAQLPNEAFRKDPEVTGDFNKQLRLGIHALGYFKDNEYFNKIADGYTLFGYQLQPTVQYYPGYKIKVEAGALLQKDFGNPKYKLIQPTFTVTYSTFSHHTFIFGTLNGNLNFNYIEPLWDFERQLTTPIQNGIQYLYKGKRLDLQTWVDWQVMQYEFDTKQEEIAGGFSGEYIFHKITSWSVEEFPNGNNNYGPTFIDEKISFPFQFTAKHKGGQIDVNDQPLTTIFNGAIGIDLYKDLERHSMHESEYQRPFWRNIYTRNYFVGYDDHSFSHQLPFQSGSGIYLNAGADTRWANFILSYWKGNGYISEFGGKLYQSASTTVHNPDYIEKKRQLLILRIMKDWDISYDSEYSGLTLSARVEPFYDFTTNSTEFSAGLYLNFNTDFFLTKIKSRNPEVEKR